MTSIPTKMKCSQCNTAKLFNNAHALRTHCRDKGHRIQCKDCKQIFRDDLALEQHYTHDRPAHNGKSQDSSEGSEAERDGTSSEASDEEAERTNYCKECNRIFLNADSLHNHIRHSAKHNWCSECQRDFANPREFKEHLSSTKHYSKADVKHPQLYGTSRKKVVRPPAKLDMRSTAQISIENTPVLTWSRRHGRSLIEGQRADKTRGSHQYIDGVVLTQVEVSGGKRRIFETLDVVSIGLARLGL